MSKGEGYGDPISPIAYLASPYTWRGDNVGGEVYARQVENARYEKACIAAALLAEEGEIVYSPIAMAHGMYRAVPALGGSYETWEAYDKAFLDACGMLYVLAIDGYTDSVGVREEARKTMLSGKVVEVIGLEWFVDGHAVIERLGYMDRGIFEETWGEPLEPERGEDE